MILNRSCRRPVLRYHGGKWRLAPWIIFHFPEHRIYVEPFGGAGSVLMRKPRCYSEVWNDLDDEIYNLFTVARTQGLRLVEALKYTPYSRTEYKLSFEITDDPFENARRTLVRSYMGFGSNSINRDVRSGFRASSNRSGTTPAHDWNHFPDALGPIIERFRGVTIENRDGLEIMAQHDTPETLHYCDPPYVHSTRTNWGSRAGYRFEMTDRAHRQFAKVAKSMRGKVVISGYPSELYAHLFADWRVVNRQALADGARPRTEVLWMNF